MSGPMGSVAVMVFFVMIQFPPRIFRQFSGTGNSLNPEFHVVSFRNKRKNGENYGSVEFLNNTQKVLLR